MGINPRTLLSIGLLTILAFFLFAFPVQLPGKVGIADFRPYWSSSYLLAHGRDFGDPEQLDLIERVLTGWNEPYIMHAWFAPIGNLILIPYTYLPFSRAVFYWLLTSTTVIFAAGILLWPYNKTNLWVPVVVTFGYSMTLVSLADGQINTLEVLGLALFLIFSTAKQNFRAGISLILTTIKPHLVIITLPLLLLDLVRRKQWRLLAGFFTALTGSAALLSVMYPAWPVSFWKLVTFGMGMTRETPTLNGLLVISGEYTLGKWVWLFAIGITTLIWAKYGKEWNQRTLIDVTILIGLIVAPIGWSYDQVMLILPLLRIIEWIRNRVIDKAKAWSVIVILLLANAFSYYQRTLAISDVWFVWVPLLVACIYFYMWYHAKAYSKLNANISFS
jgi:hypothetical protein